MSSKSIKRTTMPYFYLIQHIASGRLYAGSKTSKRNAFPELFMKPGGYTTSSKTVNALIKREGLNAFDVLQLIPQSECDIPVYEYETTVLLEAGAATNPMWFNCHNNDGLNFADHDRMEGVRKLYQERTGYDHHMHDPAVVQKRIDVSMEKYGVHNHALNDGVKQKREATCELRHGYKNPVYDKQKQQEMHEAQKLAIMEKYGVTSTFKLPEKREMAKQTLLEKYGVDNAAKSPELTAKAQTKRESTFREKYGVDIASVGALPWVAEKMKAAINAAKQDCPHCGKTNLPKWNRFHFDYCKQHPDHVIRQRNIDMHMDRALKVKETKQKNKQIATTHN